MIHTREFLHAGILYHQTSHNMENTVFNNANINNNSLKDSILSTSAMIHKMPSPPFHTNTHTHTHTLSLSLIHTLPRKLTHTRTQPTVDAEKSQN